MAEGAIRMGLNHPFLGVGTGDYAKEMARLQAEHAISPTPQYPDLSQPQDSYLIELAMLGLPGLSLFLWLLWAVTWPAWRCRTTPEGWFMLVYMAIFLTGSFSDTLIWGYANVFTLSLLTAIPIPLGDKQPIRPQAAMLEPL
jgi:O-antigen ligase